MKNSLLIAFRELKERVTSRSFYTMLVLGPLLILGLVYILFASGTNEKKQLNTLIMDQSNVFKGKIMSAEDLSVKYDFTSSFVDYSEFAHESKYQDYDLLVWLNEKIVSNKQVVVSYREKPSERTLSRLRFQLERRFEEVLVEQFTSISVSKFREIKTSLNFDVKNVYDPKNQISTLGGWTGYFFGTVIILFIALFGMTILRSTAIEKNNRIVEVLLSSVTPRELMTGKIIGIGISAFIQFLGWVLLIGLGLYLMRTLLFPDIFDAKIVAQQLSEQAKEAYQTKLLTAREYNQFITLVYEEIQFSVMLQFFLLFFIGGYLFYASFFSSIGASVGSESDGQPFVIPILAIILASIYSGYYALENPASELTTFFSYLPFTSPVVMLVKLGQGFPAGESYQLYLSLLTLFLSSVVTLFIAARIYKNGILQFGHRLKLKQLIRWVKNS